MLRRSERVGAACWLPHTSLSCAPLLPTPSTEFIRMAARFGATIVPFAAVGVDDSLNIIADNQQLEGMPFVGDMIKRRSGGVPQASAACALSCIALRRAVLLPAAACPPRLTSLTPRPLPMQARKGVSASREEESFVAPLAAPKLPPGRMYFVFQAPIQTSPDDLADRQRCDDLYRRALGAGSWGGSRRRCVRRRHSCCLLLLALQLCCSLTSSLLPLCLPAWSMSLHADRPRSRWRAAFSTCCSSARRIPTASSCPASSTRQCIRAGRRPRSR